MRVENSRFFRAKSALHFALNFLNLPSRNEQRVLKAGNFLNPFIGIDRVRRNFQIALNIQKNRAIGDAG